MGYSPSLVYFPPFVLFLTLLVLRDMTYCSTFGLSRWLSIYATGSFFQIDTPILFQHFESNIDNLSTFIEP